MEMVRGLSLIIEEGMCARTRTRTWGGGMQVRAHTASLPWTFSCQSLTTCIVINVLSSRACALDTEMRTAMPEGRAPGAKGGKLWSRAADRQAVGTFFLQEGLGVSSREPLQQTRGSPGYVILRYKSRYGPLPPLYPDNFVFLAGLPSRI